MQKPRIVHLVRFQQLFWYRC